MTTATGETPNPTLDQLGARLAVIRWQFGWNQREAAIACGFPAGTWREWESGRMPRNLADIATKISNRTGISDYWIMTGREGPTGPGLPRLDSNQQSAGFLGWHRPIPNPTRSYCQAA